MTSLVDHLKDDAEQLDRQAENAKLTGGETYVRVKDPSILSSDLKRAANEIERLRAALSTPPAAAVAVDFEAALDAFWNVAYTQGQEQGRHDDDEGTAQKAEDDLRRAIAALSTSPPPVDSRDDRDFEWKLVPIKPTLEMAEYPFRPSATGYARSTWEFSRSQRRKSKAVASIGRGLSHERGNLLAIGRDQSALAERSRYHDR